MSTLLFSYVLVLVVNFDSFPNVVNILYWFCAYWLHARYVNPHKQKCTNCNMWSQWINEDTIADAPKMWEILSFSAYHKWYITFIWEDVREHPYQFMTEMLVKLSIFEASGVCVCVCVCVCAISQWPLSCFALGVHAYSFV